MSIDALGPLGTPFSDTTMSSVEKALDGVAAQQRQTSANIANAATPGYRAMRVSFQDNLSKALSDRTDPSAVAITTQDADTPTDANGNSVLMDVETTNLMTEGLQYQSLVQAMSFKLNVLRTAITGQ